MPSYAAVPENPRSQWFKTAVVYSLQDPCPPWVSKRLCFKASPKGSRLDKSLLSGLKFVMLTEEEDMLVTRSETSYFSSIIIQSKTPSRAHRAVCPEGRELEIPTDSPNDCCTWARVYC